MKTKNLLITTFLLMLILGTGYAQTYIGGLVVDEKGVSVPGANIYLEGTYDGASSNDNGVFGFSSLEEGDQLLVVSSIGYNKWQQEINLIGDSLQVAVQLKTARNELNTVTISAGSFEASDENKAVIFRPLDIVTTAGATADIAGALNTLPGTQVVGEEGRLFVRGGDSHETQVFIDGLKVQSFYGSSVPDLPARSRFSPFLFSGTVFTTGGYSAEYGQALSSALILNTYGLADESLTSLSLMTIGLGLSHQQRWDKTSLAFSADYINLEPYIAVSPNNLDWKKGPVANNGSMIFRQETKKQGMFRLYGNYGYANQELNIPTIDDATIYDSVAIRNHNVYINANFKQALKEKWIIQAGAAYTYDLEAAVFNRNSSDIKTNSGHAKILLKYLGNENIQFRTGGEYIHNQANSTFVEAYTGASYNEILKDDFSALFVEGDFYLSRKFVTRLGLRGEHSSIADGYNIAPRLSMAWKSTENSQFSFAYGLFYQTPQFQYLNGENRPGFEKAAHYLLNYQITKEKRIFRAEVYYKTYDNLVRFSVDSLGRNYDFNNGGDGYARGIDIFYRDRESLKFTDFWISYSFLDTEREYHDFPESAPPSFSSQHNFSIVYKRFMPKLNTQVGATWSFGSGRPYDDKNSNNFMDGQTKPYNDISMNISYLTSIRDNFTILYLSVSNVFGFDNTFGYNFGNTPNDEGMFNSRPVKPDSKRFLFIGLFISFNQQQKIEL